MKKVQVSEEKIVKEIKTKIKGMPRKQLESTLFQLTMLELRKAMSENSEAQIPPIENSKIDRKDIMYIG